MELGSINIDTSIHFEISIQYFKAISLPTEQMGMPLGNRSPEAALDLICRETNNPVPAGFQGEAYRK
jgi:hypothetical protein